MDPWRIGLVVMAAIFIAFIVFRMRPRMPEEGADGEELPDSEPPPTRAELRLLKRVQKLPPEAQERLHRRLGEMLDDPDEE